MSCVEERLLSLASPCCARSLLTVRAAISSARPALRPPRLRTLSLMCWYWRSRLLLHLLCGISFSLKVFRDGILREWPTPCSASFDAAPSARMVGSLPVGAAVIGAAGGAIAVVELCAAGAVAAEGGVAAAFRLRAF